MPNAYFQFKQFVIHQDQCAMKVSTDSCLFGAWLSKAIIPALPAINRVLDIGAGTGLLMLMLAQEHAIALDGIELEESAYQQALSNIESSNWNERLQLFQGDVRSFQFSQHYDLIISNPPFYEKDLLPSSISKAVAKHDTTLNFEALLTAVNEHLKSDGYCALLIPFHRFDYLNQLALSAGFYLHHAVHVRHQEDHDFIRSMILLSRRPAETSIQHITIKEKNGAYTAAFAALLRNYYLYL